MAPFPTDASTGGEGHVLQRLHISLVQGIGCSLTGIGSLKIYVYNQPIGSFPRETSWKSVKKIPSGIVGTHQVDPVAPASSKH